STSGSNTYRGTTSGGSGPAAASAPKPNLNGSYGCGNSCTGKDDGYYHH
ncbi:colicin transporter, partial [Bifidobacterium longum]